MSVRAERLLPKDLSGEQVAAVLEGCDRPRTRFFFTLLADTGLRVGEALGLRHEDLDCPGKLLTVRFRSLSSYLCKCSGSQRV